MAMVTLVQQHQQTTLDENRCQKDQDQISITTIENCDSENSRGEIVHSEAAKNDNTAVTVAGNGSLTGSSTQCSDIEEDDEEDETDSEEGEWIPDLPVPALSQAHQQVITADGNVVLPNPDISQFGDVRVKNSTNVHLGNKTFYKGPVTIKQFVYTNPISIQEPSAVKSDNGQTLNTNTSNLPTTNGDTTTNTILSQNSVLCLDKVTKWLWTWRCASLLCILALILTISVVVASVYAGHDSPVYPEIPSPIPPNGKVRFVQRQEWGGQPPEEPLQPMKLPVPYVIISHTATDFCSTQSACTLHVRFAQTFHIESKHWSDIAYNFLVGGDGLVYVGRGWDKIGAHAFGYNNISIGISFIGTFNTVEPPNIQLVAAQRLIEIGVEEGKIVSDYKLLAHKQVSRTLSPGDKLYSIIKTWPHWSPQP
ncbi:Peptidoglycan-recognition protein LF [Anthophora quadrimaculata]